MLFDWFASSDRGLAVCTLGSENKQDSRLKAINDAMALLPTSSNVGPFPE